MPSTGTRWSLDLDSIISGVDTRWMAVPETLLTDDGVYVFPLQRDPQTAALLARARDLIAANVLWGYLLEMSKAGLPITLSMIHDVAEGVRAGDLPDRAFSAGRGVLSPV